MQGLGIGCVGCYDIHDPITVIAIILILSIRYTKKQNKILIKSFLVSKPSLGIYYEILDMIIDHSTNIFYHAVITTIF